MVTESVSINKIPGSILILFNYHTILQRSVSVLNTLATADTY